MIEIAADNGTAQRLEEYVSHPVSEVTRPACSQINPLRDHFLKLAFLTHNHVFESPSFYSTVCLRHIKMLIKTVL